MAGTHPLNLSLTHEYSPGNSKAINANAFKSIPSTISFPIIAPSSLCYAVHVFFYIDLLLSKSCAVFLCSCANGLKCSMSCLPFLPEQLTYFGEHVLSATCREQGARSRCLIIFCSPLPPCERNELKLLLLPVDK